MSEPLLAIARILGPHGVRGEVKAEVLTDFPQRFKTTRQVWLGEPPQPMGLQRARVAGRHVTLQLEGVETRDQAAALKGQLVQVPEQAAWPLPPGQYYWHQVIGLEAHATSGETLGRVAQILETGSNHVYVVHGPRGEWLLPATREVIRQVDLEQGLLMVELLPGMEPDRRRDAQPRQRPGTAARRREG